MTDAVRSDALRRRALTDHRLTSVRVALAAVTLTAAYDIVAGPTLVLAGLLTVGPCLAAGSASWRAVLGVGAYSVLMLAALSGPDGIWWTRHQLLYLLALVAITAVSALMARRQAAGEATARVAEAQFTEAFEASPIGMAMIREDAPGAGPTGRGRVARAADTLGAPVVVNDALARMCRWEAGPPPDALVRLLSLDQAPATDHRLSLDSGDEVSVIVTSTQLPTALATARIRLVLVEDVTVEREEHAVLTRLALQDQLTGLASRALLRDRITHALERVARGTSRIAVLYLDLDGFKHTNDSLGHGAGDALLVAVARRLEQAVRPEDTVARIGGDEFVVLLESVEEVAEAELVADRVQAAIAAPVLLDGQAVYPRASIGVALSRDQDAGADGVLRDADTAMYRAKGRGRARAEVFDARMHHEAVERLAVESGLHQALERSELRLRLQPIVAPASGRVLGAEALVRWQRPGHGLVPPATFIPVAEDSGLIARIDAWVMGEAIAQAARYRRERADPAFYVSVNVSAAGLADPQLARTVDQHLVAHGLPGHKLVVEVTESVYAEAVGSTLAGLAALRRMGVRLALDDFGTGFSSLTYIKKYPFDILKIDRSFVRGLLTNRNDAGIVQGVLALARGLDMDAVAEGVESPALARRIHDLRCPLAQGYTWAEPMDLAELSGLPAHLAAR